MLVIAGIRDEKTGNEDYYETFKDKICRGERRKMLKIEGFKDGWYLYLPLRGWMRYRLGVFPSLEKASEVKEKVEGILKEFLSKRDLDLADSLLSQLGISMRRLLAEWDVYVY